MNPLREQFKAFESGCADDTEALRADERRWAKHPGRKLRFAGNAGRGVQEPLFDDDGAAGPLFRQSD